MLKNFLLPFEKLRYPVLVINDLNEFIWANKKFRSLHHDIIHNDIVSRITTCMKDKKDYTIEKSKNKYYFSIVDSLIEFDSQHMTLLTLFDISKQKNF